MKFRQLLSVFLVLCLVASFFAPSFAFAANKDVVVSTIVYTYGNENATELIEGKVLTSTIELIRFDSKPEENMIYALMLYNDNKIVKADTCVVSVPSGVKKTFKTDDLVEGMVRMMETGDSFTGPVNIGNPGEFTMLELAEKVIELTGSNSRIVFEPLPQDDPRQRKPDISLAHRELNGWQPTIKLDEGLQKTIEYFKRLV